MRGPVRLRRPPPHPLSHSLTHSHTHSLSLSLSLSHTHPLSHTLSLFVTHTHTLFQGATAQRSVRTSVPGTGFISSADRFQTTPPISFLQMNTYSPHQAGRDCVIYAYTTVSCAYKTVNYTDKTVSNAYTTVSNAYKTVSNTFKTVQARCRPDRFRTTPLISSRPMNTYAAPSRLRRTR